MPKSKFFRVGVSGDTTDGRKIERSWIQQMATKYSPQTYAARINLEHIRGILPDGPFKSYGDVIALKTEEVTVDGRKELALLAQLDATADLVAMNKSRQKVFTSMEVNPNFANSGEAYLVGLAVTDSPASLGTEMLAFAAQAKVNPLAERKQAPDNLFTAAAEVTLEWEDDTQDDGRDKGEGLFARVKALLTGKQKTDAAAFADTAAAVEVIAESQKAVLDTQAKMAADFAAIQAELKKVADTQAAAAQEFAAFKSSVDAEPDKTKQRPPAAGGTGAIKTDC